MLWWRHISTMFTVRKRPQRSSSSCLPLLTSRRSSYSTQTHPKWRSMGQEATPTSRLPDFWRNFPTSLMATVESCDETCKLARSYVNFYYYFMFGYRTKMICPWVTRGGTVIDIKTKCSLHRLCCSVCLCVPVLFLGDPPPPPCHSPHPLSCPLYVE